jgi:hypothetical protein
VNFGLQPTRDLVKQGSTSSISLFSLHSTTLLPELPSTLPTMPCSMLRDNGLMSEDKSMNVRVAAPAEGVIETGIPNSLAKQQTTEESEGEPRSLPVPKPTKVAFRLPKPLNRHAIPHKAQSEADGSPSTSQSLPPNMPRFRLPTRRSQSHVASTSSKLVPFRLPKCPQPSTPIDGVHVGTSVNLNATTRLSEPTINPCQKRLPFRLPQRPGRFDSDQTAQRGGNRSNVVTSVAAPATQRLTFRMPKRVNPPADAMRGKLTTCAVLYCCIIYATHRIGA